LDTEEGPKQEKKRTRRGAAGGGRACGPYIGAVQPPFDVAAGLTSI
jgi:hypothetical protein